MEMHTSGKKNTIPHKLGEHIKELDCIYAFSDILLNPNADFDEIIQNITERIPIGFKEPEFKCACVTIFNRAFKTDNFKTCPWKLEADLTLNGKIEGKLEVGHLGPPPDEGTPFLEEERKLVQAITTYLVMVIQLKIMKDSLEKSEKRYCRLVENSLVGISESNISGDLIFANNTCIRMFGYESIEEAMSAGSCISYLNPDDRKNIMEILKQTGKISNFEAECITKKGESIFVLINATLESDVITTMMIDITEGRLADHGLVKNEMRLAEAQRIAHLGSWDWDISTGELHWSDEIYRIFGLVPQDFGETYEAFLATIHPDDRHAVRDAVDQSLADPDKAYSIEHRVVRPDGSECVVVERGEVFFDQDGRPIRMMGTVQDITERKQAEESLKKAFDELRKLKAKLEEENIYLQKEMGLKEGSIEIIGISNAINYVVHRIHQVASTRMTVLLTGDTGTGKGLFARYLHQASSRRDKPLVVVNCAGLPPTLLESELFGREKGAFTSADAKQIGRFELADGGTIFLDEIGELTTKLQAKLLRVVEDKEFERLGSPHPVKVDVRIIASSNRNLEEDVRKGRFRQDLFFRLNVFPVTVPSLAQRREDIPLLVEYFTQRFAKEQGKQIERISKKTMQTLKDYAWPGNVRELMSVVERAVLLSNGPELRLGERLDAKTVDLLHGKKDIDSPQIKGLAELEREHILRTLHKTGWQIEGQNGAARLLELKPNTLRARMKKHGIKRPQ